MLNYRDEIFPRILCNVHNYIHTRVYTIHTCIHRAGKLRTFICVCCGRDGTTHFRRRKLCTAKAEERVRERRPIKRCKWPTWSLAATSSVIYIFIQFYAKLQRVANAYSHEDRSAHTLYKVHTYKTTAHKGGTFSYQILGRLNAN